MPSSVFQGLGPGNYGTASGATGLAPQFSSSPTAGELSQAALQNAQAGAVHDPYNLGQAQLASRNQHFNQVFGLMSGLPSTFNSSVGGTSQQGPHINANPVWNAQQIQANVNANKAQGDQSTAKQVQDMQGSMAGRGWGSNSPLAAAMETQMHMGNTANTTDYARQFTQQAAQTNAQQVLAGQSAQEQQTANRNQEDIERRKTVAGSMNALIGALGGMI